MADATTILMDTLEELASYGKAVGRHQEALERAQANLIAAQATVDEKADYVRVLLKDHASDLGDSTKGVAKMFLDQWGKPQATSVEVSAPAQQALTTETAETTGRKRFSPEEAQELALSVLSDKPMRMAQIMEAIHQTEPGIAKTAVGRALGILREEGKVVTEGVRAAMTYRLA